jgi:hypothetical protein
MKILGVVFLLTLNISLGVKLNAQDLNKRVDVNLKEGNIKSLIEQIEKQSEYYFYYDEKLFEDFVININVQKQDISSVLNSVLSGTSCKFSIYEQKKLIILTKDIEITTSFEAGNHDKDSMLSLINSNDTVNSNLKINYQVNIIGIKNHQITHAILSGEIKHYETNKGIPGVFITVDNRPENIISDKGGKYKLKLPVGLHTITMKAMGLQELERKIILQNDGNLDVLMSERDNILKEVVISSAITQNINSTKMGSIKMDIKTIKQIPTVFGEADVMRVLLTQPGVQTVGEASAGFNVRGGSTDQNLILFNGNTIYNPTHFFGFFSAFNPEIINDIELYKSNIPVKYGSRLSSVLDVNMREGNKEKITGSLGIGFITSRLNVEGPIIKDKTSFLFGARTTYSNWILNILPSNSNLNDSRASFSDLNLNIHHKFNKKSSLSLTGYYSNDLSNLNTDTLFGYRNSNFSLKWKQLYNHKLTGTFLLASDGYQQTNKSDVTPSLAYNFLFEINQKKVKQEFNYNLNPKLSFDFGIDALYYQLNPGAFTPIGSESSVRTIILEKEQALESAAFLGTKIDLASFFSVDLGVRFSRFNFLGPRNVNNYPNNQSPRSDNLVSSTFASKGDNIKTYQGPEYRLATRFKITPDFSLKASYNTTRQYIHLISNSTAIAPTDFWKLSDNNIAPQFGRQVSLGFYKNFLKNTLELSVETYQKRIYNFLDFRSGANLFLNPTLETDVIGTLGRAYGTEVMLKKTEGNLNGWISYTYSRILLRTPAVNNNDLINEGREYPANYDKPHNLNITSNYRFNTRFSISFNLAYSTGRPITLPIAKYNYGNSERVFYSNRNEFRIPDYFRADISFNLDGNHNIKKASHNFWTFGIYNLTGRRNVYSLFFNAEAGVINGYQLSIFANMVPFVNYNIKF